MQQKHTLQPGDPVAHKHFKNCFGHVLSLDGEEMLMVEWNRADQERITSYIRNNTPGTRGDTNVYPSIHIHHAHVVRSHVCVVKLGVEDLCWQAAAALDVASGKEVEALEELFSACDAALSHAIRSANYPDGRLETGYSTPAYDKAREITTKFPRLKTFFEHR